MPFATARDGVRLHYRLHDHTDPWRKPATLILQHGFARSSKFWYGMVPYLARYYRVVCPDLRGLGESGTDFDPAVITRATYFSDLISIIDHLGEDKVHYAGESLGGMMGFHFAVEHEDRLRSFCAISAPPQAVMPAPESYPLFGHPTWQDALRALGAEGWCRAANASTRFPPDADPALVNWYAEEAARAPLEVLVAMSKVIQSIDFRPVLPHVKLPVLGLYPTMSATVTGEQMRLLRQVPDIRIVTFPFAYHMIWALDPAGCASHLLHFIAQVDGIPCHE